LIIEDDVALCAHLCSQLARRGFELDSSQRAYQGLNLVSHNPVDFVLLYIMLPHESGLSVLIELRREQGTPVILMLASVIRIASPASVGRRR
jgi:DNA-binding response OmpR family regulator